MSEDKDGSEHTSGGARAIGRDPKRDRWSKFWWQDWSGDLPLKSCSLAARGLWMEMLVIMHQSEDEGYFLIGGRPVSARMLAGLVNATEKVVTGCLEELKEAQVVKVNDDGVFYSKRMLKDKAARDAARLYGKEGGNPALKQSKAGKVNPEGNGGVNPPLNGDIPEGDNLNAKGCVKDGLILQDAKKLEARSLDVREEKEDSKIPPSPLSGGVELEIAFKQFWDEYPRKRGVDAARRAFTKAVKAKADPRDIIAGLRRHSFSRDPEMRPHPATWLNAGSWKDEPDRIDRRDVFKNGFLGLIANGEPDDQGTLDPDDNPVSRFLLEHNSDVAH